MNGLKRHEPMAIHLPNVVVQGDDVIPTRCKKCKSDVIYVKGEGPSWRVNCSHCGANYVAGYRHLPRPDGEK